MLDGLVKSPSVPPGGIALHLSSLRRTSKYASFLKILRARCAPLSPTTWWRVPSFARLASEAFYCAFSLMIFQAISVLAFGLGRFLLVPPTPEFERLLRGFLAIFDLGKFS
jgi:hypothetical protein